MSMTRLVVLANSWKHSDWCIAGIDLNTGAWVRPVTGLDDGRVPKAAMRLKGYFPQLRDIIELPLAESGPGYGFEKENKTLLPGEWVRHGKLPPEALLPYARSPELVLYTPGNCVPLTLLQQKPETERHSLELVHTTTFRIRKARKRDTGEPTWQGILRLDGSDLALRITDPVLVGKLSAGYVPGANCLLTLSLSMPYTPPDYGNDCETACWKLIAGVIELQESGEKQRDSA